MTLMNRWNSRYTDTWFVRRSTTVKRRRTRRSLKPRPTQTRRTSITKAADGVANILPTLVGPLAVSRPGSAIGRSSTSCVIGSITCTTPPRADLLMIAALLTPSPCWRTASILPITTATSTSTQTVGYAIINCSIIATTHTLNSMELFGCIKLTIKAATFVWKSTLQHVC